jgi:GTP-binding protein HflX
MLVELRKAAGAKEAAILSAATGEGVAALEERIAGLLTGAAQEVSFILPLSDGRRMAWLHAHGEVLAEEDAGYGATGPQRRVTVRLNPKELGQFATLDM